MPTGRAWCIILLLVLIAACGEDEPNNPVRSTPSSAETSSAPTLDLRPTLEIQYETLRQVQQQMEQIWTDLQAGRSVSCATEIGISVPPEAVSGDLFQAAVALDEAILLWQAECDNPRQQPPADVIDRGVRAALAAGDALRRVEETLSQ